MITNIYSFDLSSKNHAKSMKNNKMSVPVNTQENLVNFSNYTSANVKAKYMPLSFGAQNKEKAMFSPETEKIIKEAIIASMPPEKAMVTVNSIPIEQRLKGEYYDQFTDDLAILLGSEKKVILNQDKGSNPEIMIHNFAKKVNEGKYVGMGFAPYNTDVIYINDPVGAAVEYSFRDLRESIRNTKEFSPNGKPIAEIKERSIVDVIKQLEHSEGKNKLVFINNFNHTSRAVNALVGGKNLKSRLESIAPNLSIIGLMDNGSGGAGDAKSKAMSALEAITGSKAQDVFEDIPELNLRGLNTIDAVDFLKKNPKFLNDILKKHKGASIKISDNALKELIDKSSVTLDGSLPGSALKMLDMITTAKLNETKITTVGKRELKISSADVKGFFNKHSDLVDILKTESGRFSIAENVTTKLSDVGGISSIKQDIQDDIIAYLKNPKKFISERGSAPKGILFEGPPGTGKTLLARAIAGETNTPFISVSGSEFVERLVGEGASRVRELFATARQAAANSANKTAIIFFDEFDALAKARRGGGSGGDNEYEQTLNQLLTEMDGFNNKESKTKIIVMAATNRKDILDPAAIRPGRFDDTFTIANPKTISDRLEILNIHAKKLKFANETEKVKILNEAARMTEDMSGAELANIMKKAQKIVSKRPNNKVITHNDIVEGLLQTIAGPIKKVDDDVPFEDVVKTVRHEGGHATVIDFLKPLFNEKISFITLDNRGDFLGAVFHHSPKVNPNFKSVILSAAVSYAGGMAEPMFDSQGQAAGARQDLSNATNLFRRAITEWGQGVYTPKIALAEKDNQNGESAAENFYQTMRQINQKNIEKDINLFSKTSIKIAQMVNDFHEDFLNDYVERFKANAGKGGNNLSGEEFSKLRQAWLAETGKIAREKHLLKKVDSVLDHAFNSNQNIFQRLFKKIAKTVR